MVRIAIVEDDELYSSRLHQYLEKYSAEKNVEINIRIYKSGEEMIGEGYKAAYDIILMDIQMDGMDGMAAAKEIRKADMEVIILFITNLPQYAVRGYEADALDYILKPVSYTAFSQKIGRAVSKISSRTKNHVVLAVKGGILRLETADIYYVKSEKNNLVYHTKNENFISRGTMKQAEETLQGMHFFRGNHGYLINLEHVEGIQGKYAIVKGEEIPLSRPRSKAFKKELVRYWSERN